MWVFKSNCLNTVSLSKKNNEEAQNQAMGIRHSSFFLFVNTVKKNTHNYAFQNNNWF